MLSSQIRHQGSSIRNLSKRMASTVNNSSFTPTPIVEIREYDLHPSQAQTYIQTTTDGSDLRKSLAPLRVFSMPETGGLLNVATHLYYFEGGFEERNDRRKKMGKNADWKAYLGKVRPCMISQKSTIFVEAPLVKEMDQVCGLSPGSAEAMLDMYTHTDGTQGVTNPDCVIEFRRYQLKLGYDTVPNFLELYGKGLPSKLNATGTGPTTSLVTLLYSEVGQLNEVIEIWRHGSTSAMERSRVAARSAEEWRNSVMMIANLSNVFTSTIHKPLSFSPLR